MLKTLVSFVCLIAVDFYEGAWEISDGDRTVDYLILVMLSRLIIYLSTYFRHKGICKVGSNLFLRGDCKAIKPGREKVPVKETEGLGLFNLLT